jgi:hypothetical protein
MKILRMKNAIRAKSALDEKEKIFRTKDAVQDVSNHKAEVHKKKLPAEQENCSETIQPLLPTEKIMYIFTRKFHGKCIYALSLARWNVSRRKAKLRN